MGTPLMKKLVTFVEGVGKRGVSNAGGSASSMSRVAVYKVHGSRQGTKVRFWACRLCSDCRVAATMGNHRIRELRSRISCTESHSILRVSDHAENIAQSKQWRSSPPAERVGPIPKIDCSVHTAACWNEMISIGVFLPGEK